MSWVLFITWLFAVLGDSVTTGWCWWIFFLWIGAACHDCRRV